MKKIKEEDIYKIFKPELTPKKMLEMGVFGGSYFGNNVKEVPINFYKDGRVKTKNHLSTINDGLRSLKLLLIFCPKYIYFIPSTLLFLLEFLERK